MNLHNKVVIVTGAGTGLGRSIAIGLCFEGAKVVLAARRQDKLGAVVAQCGGDRVLALPTDVTRYSDLRHLIEATLQAFGRIDVVVNNAGVAYGGIQGDLEPEEIERVVRVNLIGPMWLVDLALPHMRERPESMVVNIVSLSGLVAIPSLSAYCASKFGLSGYTHALRQDLAGTATRVLGVYPGAIDTEMNTAAMRQKIKDEGFELKALPPDYAAARVIAAMKQDRETVIPSAPAARMLPFLDRWSPRLLRARLKKIAPYVRTFVLEGNKWFRYRNKLSKLG
jgi:NAD(P)-dependent dehydrogenase (short-subunit alcohol dehydrogenase family)